MIATSRVGDAVQKATSRRTGFAIGLCQRCVRGGLVRAVRRSWWGCI